MLKSCAILAEQLQCLSIVACSSGRGVSEDADVQQRLRLYFADKSKKGGEHQYSEDLEQKAKIYVECDYETEENECLTIEQGTTLVESPYDNDDDLSLVFTEVTRNWNDGEDRLSAELLEEVGINMQEP
ncbi:unnamed protein product [Cylicocyclus nassatus]|uniref:Uncharacterized protein n=1 Tax=Cylicocyclus nassatus TaxID=53992 RepID=A0AA36DT14_CYLNA|nr:unnamed protein product [Cylicocyclus nassatus]